MLSKAYAMNPSSAPYSHSLPNDNERYFNGTGKGVGGLMEAWDCGINKRDLTLKLPSVFWVKIQHCSFEKTVLYHYYLVQSEI